MIALILSASLLLASPNTYHKSSFQECLTPEEWDECYGTPTYNLVNKKAPLTEFERNRLFKAAEENAMDALRCLSKAEAHFSKITDIKLRDLCTSAVIGALATITVPGGRAKGIAFAISVVSSYCTNTFDDFWEGYDYLTVSRKYANTSDAYQERLFRP